MPNNFAYQTDAIGRFYSSHRRKWAEFYPSERWMLEKIVDERGKIGRVLDVGCAAGGLAQALCERFPAPELYTGVEINAQAAAAARAVVEALPMPANVFTADICDCPQLATAQFELVTSLSVADWNTDTNGILATCWDRVAAGGHLVISLRLTPQASLRDPAKSYQYVWFDDAPIPPDAERAPYVVFNTVDAITLLTSQEPKPDRLIAYGYGGKPSATAHLPYDRLVFAVFAVRKATDLAAADHTDMELHLPDAAFAPR